MSIDLAAIEKREKATTKGPWELELAKAYDVVHDIPSRWWLHGDIESEIKTIIGDLYGMACGSGADADFIAHARADIPALVAEVRRLEMDYREERELREYKNDCVEAGIETIRQQDGELKRYRELVKEARTLSIEWISGTAGSSSRAKEAGKHVKEFGVRIDAQMERIAELLKEVEDGNQT